MYKQISGMKEIIENHNNDGGDITDKSDVALREDQSDLVVKWRRTNLVCRVVFNAAVTILRGPPPPHYLL